MGEDPSKVGSSAVGSSARSRMTADYDRDEDDGISLRTPDDGTELSDTQLGFVAARVVQHGVVLWGTEVVLGCS